MLDKLCTLSVFALMSFDIIYHSARKCTLCLRLLDYFRNSLSWRFCSVDSGYESAWIRYFWIRTLLCLSALPALIPLGWHNHIFPLGMWGVHILQQHPLPPSPYAFLRDLPGCGLTEPIGGGGGGERENARKHKQSDWGGGGHRKCNWSGGRGQRKIGSGDCQATLWLRVQKRSALKHFFDSEQFCLAPWKYLANIFRLSSYWPWKTIENMNFIFSQPSKTWSVFNQL